MLAPADNSDEIKTRVCAEIRSGKAAKAIEILCAKQGWESQAQCLNLRGAIHEILGETRGAWICYGAALSADPHYLPALLNFRRRYEIHMFGKSDGHLLLGDEQPAVQSPELWAAPPAHHSKLPTGAATLSLSLRSP